MAKNERYKADEYILYEKDGYRFNWNSEHYIDFIKFENNCKKSERSLKNNNFEELIHYASEAIEIYKGNLCFV